MSKLLIGKDGVNSLTATDPNDFIFNSDLNTFKIVDTDTITGQTISGDPTTISRSHGLSSTVPVVYAVIKFPNGRKYLPGSIQPTNSTSFFRYWSVEADDSNIYFNVHKGAGSNFNVDIKYFVFEPTVSGSGTAVGTSDVAFRIAKGTNDVLTETLLDNLIFDSDFDTLKYFSEGSATLNISSGDSDVEQSVSHGLGYSPFFMTYLELDFNLGAGNWSQVPFNFGSPTAFQTITSSVDDNNIYFRATNAGFTFGDMTLNFTYKIFRNDLII